MSKSSATGVTRFTPYIKRSAVSTVALGAVLLWAIFASVAALQSRPQLVVIGIDEQGARLISDNSDLLLFTEKKKFLQEFIRKLYEFNATNYRERIGQAGNLMAASLWESRLREYTARAEKLKGTGLSETAVVKRLAEIEPGVFECNIELTISQGIETRVAGLRTTIRTAKRERTAQNPYVFEVTGYDEQETGK